MVAPNNGDVGSSLPHAAFTCTDAQQCRFTADLQERIDHPYFAQTSAATKVEMY